MANYDYCLIGSATDVGRVRKANEDRCAWFDTDNGRVGVVCDGMGGHVGGQIASQTALDAIKEYLNTHIIASPQEAIRNSITYANQAILQRASVQPELTGMGSTCVMLLIRDGRVFYGHVGDSRIYIISSRTIRQLTKDHSFVQMLVDAGQITAEQAEHHPRKNEITNALGLPNMQPPTVCIEPIEPDAGAAFLLCSDGLTGMVSDRSIEKVVSNRAIARLDDRAGELVRLANEAGGVDNISVLLVEFALSTSDILSVDEPKSNKPKRGIMTAIISSVLLLICFGGWYGYKSFCTKNAPTPIVDTIQPVKNDTLPISTPHLKKDTVENVIGEVEFVKYETGKPIKLPTKIGLQYKFDPSMVKIQSPYNNSLKCIAINTEKNDLIIERKETFDSISKPLIIYINLDSIDFKLIYKVEFEYPDSGGKKSKGEPVTESRGDQDSSTVSTDTLNKGNSGLGGIDVGSVPSIAAPPQDTDGDKEEHKKKKPESQEQTTSEVTESEIQSETEPRLVQ